MDRTGSLWAQVTPLASAEDADAPFENLPRLLTHLRASVTLVAERDVDPPAVPGVQRPWAREHDTTGRAGPGTTFGLGMCVGPFIACVFSAGEGHVPGWEGVGSVAGDLAAPINAAPLG
ncbi:MAG TPA: hypothetical protein VFJ85_04745 [Acidimicrobiales bacterium]|nr:hypothetical protein [Acidimicrobiales bacterium]